MKKIFYFITLFFIISGCVSTIPASKKNDGAIDHIPPAAKEKTKRIEFSYQKEIIDRMKNTINIALSDKESLMNDNNPKLYTNAELGTFYFDSTRILNNFATLKLTHFPQQYKSKIKTVILESDRLKKGNMRIDKDGFIEVTKNVNLKDIKAIHDLMVAIPVTRGIKPSDDEERKIQGHIGYAMSKNDTEIRYFATELKNFATATELKNLPSGIQNLGKNLIYVVLDKDSFASLTENLHKTVEEGARIISLSYSPLINANEENSDDSYNYLLNNKNKYILLTALKNDINKYDGETGKQLRSQLKEFQKSFENSILVSTSKFDVTAQNKDRFSRRENLVNDGEPIEFFTILANYNVIPVSKNDRLTFTFNDEDGATSFATPLLARIIFNMLSLSPKMSNAQIKDILRKSALNYNTYENDKSVGYIVNPEKAYILTLGSLIANAQAYSYKTCTNANIEINGAEFVVHCDPEQNIINVDENQKYNVDLEEFYSDSVIYTSNFRSRNNISVTKESIENIRNSNRIANPKKITIRNLKVDYGKCEPTDVKGEQCKEYKIAVTFDKDFNSETYNDSTTKIMIIDYGKGTPQLEKEYVVETRQKL